MSDVKWIKLMTDILNNEKIDAIRSMPEGDSIFVIWVGILCLAGKTNDNGFFYISPEIPFTEDLISRRFNEPINTVRLAFSVLQRFGMIDIINDIYHVSNWEKYQSTDRLAEIREYNRIAKQRSEKIENAGLAVLKGAGHYAFLEQPAVFRQIIRSFLIK